MVPPPLSATTAGLLLALGCAAAAGIVVHRFTSVRAGSRRAMVVAAGSGLAFQVVHVLEHGLQLTFWVLDPEARPWLSAWAGGTADGLRYFCSLVPAVDAPPSLGVEMLHLTGNVVFLGALTAWQVVMRSGPNDLRALHVAEKVQLFHVAEHALLVTSLLVFGKAQGFSTAFGAVDGAALVALRVWFHFTINAVATGFALMAMTSLWMNRRLRRRRGPVLRPAI